MGTVEAIRPQFDHQTKKLPRKEREHGKREKKIHLNKVGPNTFRALRKRGGKGVRLSGWLI